MASSAGAWLLLDSVEEIRTSSSMRVKDLRLRLFPRMPCTSTAVGGGLLADWVHHLA